MRFRRLFGRIFHRICDYFINKWFLIVLYLKSLFFNCHMDSGYLADTLLEPMFWFVDNFTELLGPVSHRFLQLFAFKIIIISLLQIFVVSVLCLLVSFVAIAYIIGLSYWLSTNKVVTLIAVVIGHWLLINVIYHYFMALTVSPGNPPKVCIQ